MTLMGAEVLLYPTAIGSEPHYSSLDTRDPWRRVMQGHAVANVIPVAAANRIGQEPGANGAQGQSFYGSSFLADHRGDLVQSMDRAEEGVRVATFDLDFLHTHRAAWGFFIECKGWDSGSVKVLRHHKADPEARINWRVSAICIPLGASSSRAR